VTVTELHPGLHEPRSEPGTDLWVEPPEGGSAGPAVAPGSLDALVADGAEVTRRLALVPHRRVVSIPAQAVAFVADLDIYGD